MSGNPQGEDKQMSARGSVQSPVTRAAHGEGGGQWTHHGNEGSAMEYTYSLVDNPDKFVGHHWTQARLPNNRHLVTMTGIVIPHISGHPDMQLNRGRLTLILRFPDLTPPLAPGQAFWIEHWAPFFTISAIDKGGDNHYGGWGVDEFGLAQENIDSRNITDHRVGIWASFWVRGREFIIYRFGYSLTLLGEIR